MRALLLAAGLGTRLRPITDTVPKCLVCIRGRPLLEYWLDMLLANGIERILVNTHYFADQVRDFVSKHQGRDRIEIAYEGALLGTGGTVLRNREFFREETFMVVHADNLSRFDVSAFVQRHRQRPPHVDITMLTFDTDDPRSCGIVVEDERGIVLEFHEKSPNPPGRRANGAVYIFEAAVLEFLTGLGKEFIDLSTEVLPRFLGRIQTYHNADYHRDIGTPDSLRLARATFGSTG